MCYLLAPVLWKLLAKLCYYCCCCCCSRKTILPVILICYFCTYNKNLYYIYIYTLVNSCISRTWKLSDIMKVNVSVVGHAFICSPTSKIKSDLLLNFN